MNDSIVFKRPSLFLGQNKRGYSVLYRLDYRGMSFNKVRQIPGTRRITKQVGTRIDDDKIMISGGYDKRKSSPSLFNIVCDLKKRRLVKLPPLQTAFSSFSTVLLGDRVFFIGLVKQENGYKTKAECFNFIGYTWKNITPPSILVKGNCCFVYFKQIWVIGWKNNRSKNLMIGKYNEETDSWKQWDLNVRLNSDYQSNPINSLMVMQTARNNEIAIFHKYDFVKKTDTGNKFFVLKVDLFNQQKLGTRYFELFTDPYFLHLTENTKDFKPIMADEENGIKLYKYNRWFDTFSVHDVKNKKKKKIFHDHLMLLPINPAIKFNPYTDPIGPLKDYSNKDILFGEKHESFQMEIDYFTGEIEVNSVPLELDLSGRYNTRRLSDVEVLFFSFTRQFFVYNFKIKEVIYLPRLPQQIEVFHFYTINNVIYAIMTDKEQMAEFQIRKLDYLTPNELAWEIMDLIDFPPNTKMFFNYNKKLFAISFLLNEEGHSPETISVFDTNRLKWRPLAIKLGFPMNRAKIIRKEDRIVYYRKEANAIYFTDIPLKKFSSILEDETNGQSFDMTVNMRIVPKHNVIFTITKDAVFFLNEKTKELTYLKNLNNNTSETTENTLKELLKNYQNVVKLKCFG